MFREMRRRKNAVSHEVCAEILKNEKRGVLSLIGDDGYPYGIPMDFRYDEAENKIYFHSAGEGHKIDAIKRCDKAGFTAWNSGYLDSDGWSWHVTSVVVMGRASLVTDEAKKNEELRLLGMKYFPSEIDVENELKKDGARASVIELTIEHMSGKLVHER